jgi:hypothetical protein
MVWSPPVLMLQPSTLPHVGRVGEGVRRGTTQATGG